VAAVIVGAGGHGVDIAAWSGLALVDDKYPERGAGPVVGPREFVAGVNDSEQRFWLCQRLDADGWTAAEAVAAPTAYLGPRVVAQPGCVLSPRVTLANDVRLGCHVHLNVGVFATRARIGAYTTVGPGTNICGDVDIGLVCRIGAGVTIANLVTVGDRVTVGAGAVVVDDLVDPGVYVGCPARKCR